uniref:Calmodulin n=1 Tax=Chromera velia CCMP2878 TaxID=1169474 RepID=A0A0G4HSN1_9ALVE|eukprot:Cvel_8270.t1-p1 / transcript=Cvel_8270.t1 / gene=Cvel_8270 / organism=Chromera_velia_CCMP2878 / gene_product=Troponin C, slow skeletal and cardiac muscles, putative / transcript_product=Troponin C, slow skeletal and cardiac muscles, putative / location=Cvel_scaffold453:40172-42942(+) / protein_length=214 / sequence_SO=supercontig / SO=protein_coding / is_pseudo=false
MRYGGASASADAEGPEGKKAFTKESISQVELDALKRVFKRIAQTPDQTSSMGSGGHSTGGAGSGSAAQQRLSWQNIHDVLVKLGHRMNKREIELMIWEVDDDLDGMVSWDEFLVMYQRCVSDKTGLEPRKLFHVVQFLMYDKDGAGLISVEQTLQILFVRFGRDLLDHEIQAIFGEEEKGPDGQEKRINFSGQNTKKGVTYPKLSTSKKMVFSD